MRFVTEMLADDVFGGILYFMKTEGKSKFCTDPNIIHEAIYNLREKKEFKNVLNKFTFDTRGIYPRSRRLENSINHFQLSGFLERINPKFSVFKITDFIDDYFKKDIKDIFSEQQKKQLNGIAKEFAEMVE